eukprot:TRINITY_DN8319_c0_g1_i3.p1 TRINITY_DN8319_c0_g1~~TRINITY_DN8319_c0_g1_i3.p1  ORF type:complete len:167 (+),score=32.08 TRINITY_DN8319_c0_g1_i3:413-913(+)
MMKDPRMCLTLPVWRKVIKNPFVIVAYRNPIGVAKSLVKRNQFNFDFSLALWEKYMSAALETSKGLDRICVSYEDVLQDPMKWCTLMFKTLSERGIKGLRIPTADELAQFVDPNLNHSRGMTQDHSPLSPSQSKLYQSLVDGTALHPDAAFPLPSSCLQSLHEPQR